MERGKGKGSRIMAYLRRAWFKWKGKEHGLKSRS